MRILLSALFVLPLAFADLAPAQTRQRSATHRRSNLSRNRARVSRRHAVRRIAPRATHLRTRNGRSDWKQRLAAAQRMQLEQRLGVRRSGPYNHNRVGGPYRATYGDPYWAYDDYYGNIYAGPRDVPPEYGPYNNPYGYYGGPAVILGPNDYSDIFSNQRYYDDGPNGPGYYDKSRWYNWSIAQKRTDQLHEANSAGVDEGMTLFRQGAYDRAAVAWLNASTYDEGDAASRLHAGNALFALGRYDDAVKLLARAFELAPQLAGASFDIRNDYVRQQDFTTQFDRLKAHVAQQPNDLAGLTLMGYVLSYTDGPSHAYTVLQRAHALAPNDTFVEKLWNVAKQVGPAETAPRAYQPQSQQRQPYVSPQRQQMQPMRPVPSSTPKQLKSRGEPLRQINNPKAPPPKPGKMRLVSAEDPHR